MKIWKTTLLLGTYSMLLVANYSVANPGQVAPQMMKKPAKQAGPMHHAEKSMKSKSRGHMKKMNPRRMGEKREGHRGQGMMGMNHDGKSMPPMHGRGMMGMNHDGKSMPPMRGRGMQNRMAKMPMRKASPDSAMDGKKGLGMFQKQGQAPRQAQAMQGKQVPRQAMQGKQRDRQGMRGTHHGGMFPKKP